MREPKHWLTIFLPVIILVVGVAVAPQFLTDLEVCTVKYGTASATSRFSNFLSLEPLRDVSMTVLFFCFVAPVRDFATSIGRPDWNYIASSWPTIFALCAMAGVTVGFCGLSSLAASFGNSSVLARGRHACSFSL